MTESKQAVLADSNLINLNVNSTVEDKLTVSVPHSGQKQQSCSEAVHRSSGLLPLLPFPTAL